MPFINVKTNTTLPQQKIEAVKAKLGQAITAIPGKSEGWLMVNVEDACKLYFKGSDAPAAMVQVTLYGKAADSAVNTLAGRITAILGEEAGISADRIYVSCFATDQWGWNGNLF